MISKRVIGMLGAGVAAVTLVVGLSTGAEAQDGFTNGSIINSVAFVGCSGQLQEGFSTSTGDIYARALFGNDVSSRGLECQGWLERTTDGGSTWTTVSDIHLGAGGTDYYYDAGGYEARVCVGDFLYSNSYSCAAWW